jgi:arylformamidase
MNPNHHDHLRDVTQSREIIDISPLISEALAVWPGDTPVQRDMLCDISQGSNIDLSTIRATVHLGAHADAPHHYHRDGQTMESLSLSPYIGPCMVVSVPQVPLILPKHCETALKSCAKRILFKTRSYPNPNVFNENFTAFHADAVAAMGEAGVILIGIDTPSVDPFHSKDLPAHQMLFRHRIANLEGLVLDHVTDGLYELIALPLKLKGFDASPVRAILRDLE